MILECHFIPTWFFPPLVFWLFSNDFVLFGWSFFKKKVNIILFFQNSKSLIHYINLFFYYFDIMFLPPVHREKNPFFHRFMTAANHDSATFSLSLSHFFHWSTIILNICCYISNSPRCQFIFYITLNASTSLFPFKDQFLDYVTSNITFL